MRSDLPLEEDIGRLSSWIKTIEIIAAFIIPTILLVLGIGRFYLNNKKTAAVEKQAGPRSIPNSPKIREELKGFISPYKDREIQIVNVGGDKESLQFAEDLRPLFAESGWIVKKGELVFMGGSLPTREIEIEHKEGEMSEETAAVLRVFQRLNCKAVEMTHNRSEGGSLIVRVGLHGR